MDIKEKVKSLPASPGVYLMKDSLSNIIYVGKSKNLKNRVGSYFINLKNRSPKIEKLVKNLKDFDIINTDTEFEAFMLECKLIKELKPAYNRIMKSPLSYAYIQININEKYPTIEVVGNCEKTGDFLCFGPYPNKNTVERAINGIKEVSRILCSKPASKTSSCLNYSLGLCIGMCLGESEDQYKLIINKVINLLNNEDRCILEDMQTKMLAASERLDFETAVKYRDYIEAIKSLLEKEKVIGFTNKNRNIILFEPLNDGIIKFFLIKGNKVLFSEKYIIDTLCFDEIKEIIVTVVQTHFHREASLPSTEVGRDEIDEAQIIYSYLQNKSNGCKYIIVPSEWIDSNNSSEIEDAIDNLKLI